MRRLHGFMSAVLFSAVVVSPSRGGSFDSKKAISVTLGYGSGLALAAQSELLPVADGLAFTGGVRYRRYTWSYDYFDPYFGYDYDSPSFSVSTFSLEPGLRYRIPLEGSILPFAEAGIGLCYVTVGADAGYGGPWGMGVGLSAGVGADYVLNDAMRLTGHLGYYATGYEVGLGLSLPIGD